MCVYINIVCSKYCNTFVNKMYLQNYYLIIIMWKHCKILVVVVVIIFNHITNTFVKHFYCNDNLLVFNITIIILKVINY